MKKYTNNCEHIIFKGEPAFLIEKGSVVSTVSRVPRDSYKTNINNVSSSDLYKEQKGQKVEYDFDKKYPNGFKENSTERFELEKNKNTQIDDYDDFENTGGNDDDYYESNCDGADIPDHIDPYTADFDCEGNYCGGVIMDLSDD